MKLYKVTLRGCYRYKTSYVVAQCSSSAYRKVRAFLDKNNLGLAENREMKSIELLADTARYGECGTMLLLAEKTSNGK